MTNTSLDNSYNKQFLLTFRYFISPRLLLNKLILKFVTASNNNDITAHERKATHARLLVFLEEWVQHHFYDFENDTEMMKTLQNFVDTTVSGSDVASMTTMINQRIDERVRTSVNFIDLCLVPNRTICYWKCHLGIKEED
jgi:hypothetical protein